MEELFHKVRDYNTTRNFTKLLTVVTPSSVLIEIYPKCWKAALIR
jgi:hypothetical protein